MAKRPPTRAIRPPSLRVDPEKYPSLETNPSLERALRIIQEMERGRPRAEAVELAELAMETKPRPGKSQAKPAGRPARARSKGAGALAAKGRTHAAKKRAHAAHATASARRRR